MGHISLNELKNYPVPVTYGDSFCYSLFIQNKTITIEIVNEHQFLINFIFEDSAGKRKYSYLDTSFARGSWFETFKKGNYPKEHFYIPISVILYNCVLTYLDEPTLIEVLNEFGYAKEVECTSEFQKAVFVDNVYFMSSSTHSNSTKRNFSMHSITHNNSSSSHHQLELKYIISESSVYRVVTDINKTVFPSIFSLAQYSEDRAIFHWDQNIFNDDFTSYFYTDKGSVRVIYIDGELSFSNITKFCEDNRSKDPAVIHQSLTYLMFLIIQHKPTKRFVELVKHIYPNVKVENLTLDEFKLFVMYQI